MVPSRPALRVELISTAPQGQFAFGTILLKSIVNIILCEHEYLTIRLRARDFYEVIVDEGEARINYHLTEIESE